MGAFGDAHSRATVTEDQVRQIIRLLQSAGPKRRSHVSSELTARSSKALLADGTGSTSPDQQTSTPQFAPGPN
jgi:hypothetical protein